MSDQADGSHLPTRVPASPSKKARRSKKKPARSKKTPAVRAAPRSGSVSEPDWIEVRGASEHNLKIDQLRVPKRELVVFTGVSGSGKSSLAFDTLYAEGQRRYIESLSSYARQFLGQLERPKVEHISGLSPTIAIEQKAASSNPRSTVGTITEIYDYLRVLYARVGTQYCHECGKPVASQSAEQIVGELLALPEGSKATLLAPLVVHRKGEFRELFEELRGRGFVRVRVDGELHRLEQAPTLDKKFKHSIELVVDRIKIRKQDRMRITESVELALREGKGELQLLAELAGASGEAEGKTVSMAFSQERSCCGLAFPELSPQSFSFNSPLGMCPDCNGLGTRMEVDPELVIADETLSIRDGAIGPWSNATDREAGWTWRIIEAVANTYSIDLDKPWNKLGKRKRGLVLYGSEGKRIRVKWGTEGEGSSHGEWGMRFEGVVNSLERRFSQTASESAREHYRKYFREADCETCGSKRLRSESLAVRIRANNIAELTSMTVADAQAWVGSLELTGAQKIIAEGALREIVGRLGFLLNVGLDYLTLDRSGPTLSGGEAQRIRLASQLGSELSGVMYVLDEPSIGLHQRDNQRLIATLQRLRDLGNTVLVVEHDEDTIRAANHVVDFGPGAGHLGGEVVYSGTAKGLERCKASITGGYLSGKKRIEVPAGRREPSGEIWVRGAAEHNLADIDIRFPLGVLCAITGVSGAGKSSLVNGILLPALGRMLHGSSDKVGEHREITGLEALDKVIAIDQRPIGRTPRSNPGTYTKAFDEIRSVFAQLPESRTRGWKAGRFSFNVKGGRCEACSGDGVVKVEMHFLADVYVPCEVCNGRRYNQQTLAVRYRGHSITDVLALSIDECAELFSNHRKLARILTTLTDVGLGYMKIGQTAPTMSGGEAQRVKLSRELGKVQTGRTLYVLDEPTTGLHFEDIARLLGVLQRLVDGGNTVVVIEHNLDVIKCADWIIDLGPEGGAGGGRLVVEGTPEQVAKHETSYTGQFLASLL
ncbi:excinuclease ABC subunit UvrA [Enhygromyxa salina]|uniref:UvrABC system protein A n=1 Tax=Enhygromyxa salina TaxID=215803 RepID=A0A2S9Y3F4_9BACT|nr:excinuclease ABC subunit UvrA [Enhygromyxa salina]PRP99626.1 UvrABC system protein A [Enhygromyxa salina]